MNILSNPQLRGWILAFGTACLLGFIAGTIVYFSPVKEYHLPVVAHIIVIVSVFAGAAYAAALRRRKGLITGLTVGLVFLVTLLLLSLILFHSPFSGSSLLREFLLITSSAVLGGILGVSMGE